MLLATCTGKCQKCERCDPTSGTCKKDKTSSKCRSNPCERVSCVQCRKCIVNSKGYPRCVQQSGCCPSKCQTYFLYLLSQKIFFLDDTRPVNCLIDPCRFASSECLQSTHCIATYCTGCDAIYYDKLWNKIPKNKCVTEETKAKVCIQFPETGPCKAKFTRYYYDQPDAKCKPFRYGGCKGNGNNFKSSIGCQAACNGTMCKFSFF